MKIEAIQGLFGLASESHEQAASFHYLSSAPGKALQELALVTV